MRTTTHSPAAAAGRTVGRVLKAGASLLILAAAVAGLPLLLAWVTPVIWASAHDDLTHLLHRQDTGAAFLVLLVVIGWTGWAQFTFCAVRELLAQLRGRTWQAPRGLGASQRAAALLIGSILALVPTSSALASDAQAAPPSAAAHLPGQAKAPPTAEPGQVSAPAVTSNNRSYTVRETRPAESLWSIAERELGNGERWRDIAALNEGRTMADGQVFRANSFLQPGWQLKMPDSPTSAGGVRTQLDDSGPSAAEDNEHVVTVHPGDYLSKIAEEELGDGDAWPQLFEASQDKPQPHGLPQITDPDIIYAGQQVTVPSAQSDQPPRHRDQDDNAGSHEARPPAPQKPDSEQKPGADKGDEQAPAPSHTTAPAPEPSAPSTPASRPAEQPGQDQASPPVTAPATPGPSTNASPPADSPPADSPSVPAEPSRPAASPAAPTPEAPATAPASNPLNLRTVLGAGALLAAAVTGALALRRTLQRRRRKPGETIAIASETSTAEAQLAAAAEPDGAARLDAALRTLAHHVAQEEDALLPPLRAARIGARTVEVLPDDLTQHPAAPFVAGQGGWWVLPADAVLLDEETARKVPAPYPGLVTIGTTEDGDLLLLNLAQLPALLLDGNPVHITEMCTSLALELGMSPWASDIELVTIGFGEDLPQLLPTTRIAHMRHATHALQDLSERLLEAHQMPETQHQPYLLLCASSLDADTAWQFADVIDKSGTVPVTLIAPANTAAAHFPEAEILNASLSVPQNVDYTGTDITVQRLEHAAYQQITTALKVSAQPPHPAEGPWQDVPAEPDNQQPEQAIQAEPTSTDALAPVPAEVSGEVFPALLAASADPAGLHLPPTTGNPADDEEEASGPQPALQPTVLPVPEAAGTGEGNESGKVPDTSEDGAAREDYEAQDLHAPEIRVLGPVEVTGVDSTGHGPRMAQLAALLYFRSERHADSLCFDMDPASPWSVSTLNARYQGLRRALGSDPAGIPYVPRRRSAEDPYQLAPGVRSDWNRFRQLAEHALPLGPAGLSDLEKALTLVRGKPFGGRPLPWAQPYQQEMTTRIIDVAHTVATHRTPTGPHQDLSAARHAIATGLEVDDTAELLYRDWMKIEHTAGNRSGLHTAITRIQHINHTLDSSLQPETEQLINQLLNSAVEPGQRPL
ncbi:hypothetical protein [Streptomyces sp. NPDC008240]|uniref:hypothetical protein n=1 Tax=Streptomyces sp. NPDC008240 TaxID=3364822 RepID=UPI0036DFCDAE